MLYLDISMMHTDIKFIYQGDMLEFYIRPQHCVWDIITYDVITRESLSSGERALMTLDALNVHYRLHTTKPDTM